MANHSQIKYWEYSVSEVLRLLKTQKRGLDSIEVKRRIFKYGKNEIQIEKKRTAVGILFSQFKSPLVLILIIASIISGFLGEVVSTFIIILIILTSAFLAFFQEYKSERIIQKLRKRVSLKVSVVRQGKTCLIPVSELTVGDIVILDLGTVVPADLRLIATDDLLINEAILTGESFPVEKIANAKKVKAYLPQSMQNLAFSGTHVVQGSGRGVVIAVGKCTELGKTAHLLQVKPQNTEFQKGIADFGLFLSKIILLFSFFLFFFLAFFKHDWIQSLLFALAIAVGISPELLPIIITINLSQGAKKMSKKFVIIKRLMSIEDLGNTDILCTDKTGTLTSGQISLRDYTDFDSEHQNIEILKLAWLCNTFTVTKNVFGNPLDEAVYRYGKHQKISSLVKDYKIIDSLSFDFKRRKMSVISQIDKSRQLICKGASEEILKSCRFVKLKNETVEISKVINRIKKKIDSLEAKGLRLVLVAYRDIENKKKYTNDDEKDLTLVGYLTFTDEVKESAKTSLPLFLDFGIKVKILTGDTEAVTRHLCEQINLKITGVVSGQELDNLTEAELKSRVEESNIFVKITPEHKLKIINLLKANGHTVSFLGDGVNDAPALRAADVGISVNSATDIAKEAADVILMQKSLTVLIDGIKEGRRTFGNTLKYIFCTISSNYGNMFSVAGAALFLPFIPMLPVQILLLNFLSDFPMLAVSTDEVDQEYLKKPKHWNTKIISKFMTRFGLISSVFDFLTFGFLFYILSASPSLFQAGWFLESYLTEVLLIFVLRTKKYFWQSSPSKTLIAASLLTTLIVFIFLFSPLGRIFHMSFIPLPVLLVIIFIGLIYFAITEVGKKRFYQKFEI